MTLAHIDIIPDLDELLEDEDFKRRIIKGVLKSGYARALYSSDVDCYFDIYRDRLEEEGEVEYI